MNKCMAIVLCVYYKLYVLNGYLSLPHIAAQAWIQRDIHTVMLSLQFSPTPPI